MINKHNIIRVSLAAIFALTIIYSLVNAVDVTPSNTEGWTIFGTSTSFNTANSSIGSGSLEFGPIGTSEKLVMYFPGDSFFTSGIGLGAQANSTIITYDYLVSASDINSNSDSNLYINILVDLASNGIGTFTGVAGFFDCNYAFVPANGSLNVWRTATITPTAPVTLDSRSAAGCTGSLNGLNPADQIHLIQLNGGQSTETDINLAGRYDNVVINGIVYDFEPNNAGGSSPDGSIIDARTIFSDGRINNLDNATPIVAYPISYTQSDGTNNQGIHVYEVNDNSIGDLVLIITPEQIAAVAELPEVNSLIAEINTDSNWVQLHRRTDGLFQFTVLQSNGKTYVLEFPIITVGGGGYTSFETP